MKAVLDHIEDTAANIKTFWFKPERSVHQTAGQFTELYLPHQQSDNRGDKRWFTLSNSPADKLLSITTKYAGESSSSFKKYLFSLQPGAPVSLADPMGDFVLPKDTSIPIVYVAGGIGVTPIHSMVKYLLGANEKRNITLIYAVNHQDELAFGELFQNSDIKYIPVVKEPGPGWTGEVGTVTTERILSAMRPSEQSLVYLSGPEPMVEALADALKKAGVSKNRIVTDFFPGYTSI
ncbi:MAG TPA: FAD-dependent oxidoreductase [Candidatus Saccharimonadales bacterium]|nr:FAD-dependent oxidoreductase [Candidatus Saccharimonadales bacterium]